MKRINSLIMVVVMVLVVSLCASFTACNGNIGDRVTDPSTRETLPGNIGAVTDPNQTINTMETETTSTTAPTGKYTYTVYAGTQYETTLSMDINIDDYLIDVSWSEAKFFSIGNMMKNLGWYVNGDPKADDNTKVVYDAYLYSDSQAVYRFGDDYGETTSLGAPQMFSFTYHIAPLDDYMSDKYTDADRSTSDNYYGIIVQFGKHTDDLSYVSFNNGKVAISRDDAIIIAYVFASAIDRPGENPFYGTPLANAMTSRADRYLTYSLP